jgi:hypothetical protein
VLEKARNITRATLSVSGRGPKNLERRRVMLSRLDGVYAVGVNHLTGMVSVEYDSGRITLERIRTVLKRQLR